jgi:hypothetical protein
MVSRPAVSSAGSGRELEKAANQPVIPPPDSSRMQRTLMWLTKEWGILTYYILRQHKSGRIELHVSQGTVVAVSWSEGAKDEK